MLYSVLDESLEEALRYLDFRKRKIEAICLDNYLLSLKKSRREHYIYRKVKQMTDLPMQRKCGMCIPDVRQSLMKDSIVI